MITELVARRSVLDLLADVEAMFNEPKESDTAQQTLKQQLRVNPFRQALHQVLCDEKEKKRISTKMIKDENVHMDEDERFDNMLKARGMLGPDITHMLASEVVGSEQDEYHEKLLEVRKCFEGRMNDCSQKEKELTNTVQSILRAQSEFRPIAEEEIQKLGRFVSNKFHRIPLKMKQSACEAVINLQKRYCDARRKRRNFPKTSTEILNDYFRNHLEHPYPSEEVKQALAVQCSMTVAQVSNWFGNKRIRYKKSKARDLEQGQNELKGRMAAAAAATMGSNPFLMPGPFPGMMTPYQMMVPGASQFSMGMPSLNFPGYNAEMMSQYQQTMQNVSQAQ